MKTTFITIVSAIGIFLSAQAQLLDQSQTLNQDQTPGQEIRKNVRYTNILFKKIACGGYLGINISKLINFNNSLPLLGFNTGLYTRFNIRKNIFIQPEISIFSQGFRRENLENSILSFYLSVPILLQYWITDQLAIEVGPQTSVVVGKANISNIDDLMKMNNTNLSLILGCIYNLGYFFDLPNINIITRYSIGLTNSYVTTENINSSNKSLVFYTGISYLF